MKRDVVRASGAVLAIQLLGCSGVPRPLVTPDATAACRATHRDTAVVRWSNGVDTKYKAHLDSWCAGVGPLLFRTGATASLDASVSTIDDLTLVSWNVHVGAADIDRLVADVRSGRWSRGRPRQIVLLLQEAVRTSEVPLTLPAGATAAAAIGSDESIQRSDVVRLADRLQMSVFYAPSMRNGQGTDSGRLAADRGNAILSTLPLSEPVAIELPSARQRRVAVAAGIPVFVGTKRMPLSIGTAHLDTLGPPRTLWLFGAITARSNQATSLAHALPSGPLILGADLNSWMGADEPAVRTLLSFFPATPTGARAATFAGGLVLDYMFFRLPMEWRAQVQRVPERYGSDHYPLIASLLNDTLQ